MVWLVAAFMLATIVPVAVFGSRHGLSDRRLLGGLSVFGPSSCEGLDGTPDAGTVVMCTAQRKEQPATSVLEHERPFYERVYLRANIVR